MSREHISEAIRESICSPGSRRTPSQTLRTAQRQRCRRGAAGTGRWSRNKKQRHSEASCKQRAAKISNSSGSSSRGGKSSGSGSSRSSSSQGGTTAQKEAAGRKGGKESG